MSINTNSQKCFFYLLPIFFQALRPTQSVEQFFSFTNKKNQVENGQFGQKIYLKSLAIINFSFQVLQERRNICFASILAKSCTILNAEVN